MHRIDGPSATLDNKFRSGNPQIGQQGTLVTVDWLNEVQESLCLLIEAAGIVLVKGDYTQLADAVAALDTAILNAGKTYTDDEIIALIGGAPGALDTLDKLAAAIGDDANFAATVTAQLALKADKARSITGGGLVTGGGDLSVDRVLTVTVSDAAQAQGWANNTTALTPAALALAFQGARQTLALPGSQQLPGGLTLKFGTHSEDITSDGVFSFVNFDAPFATACLLVIVCPYNPTSDANADSVPGVVSWTVNGVQARSNTTSGVATSHGFAYLAIGY